MPFGLGLGVNKYRTNKQLELLDRYSGANAAYSLRHLTNSYTGDVVLVRRSSDDTEESFTPSEIANGALVAWVGEGNNGFVKTWYDQLGSNHFTQATPTRQPLIVKSGVIVTRNEKPAIEGSNGASHIMRTPSNVFDTLSNFTSFLVGAFGETSQSNDTVLAFGDGASYSGTTDFVVFRQLSSDNNLRLNNSSGPVGDVDNGTSDTDQHLFYLNYISSTSISLGVDGSVNTDSTGIPASITATSPIDLFAAWIGSPLIPGAFTIQELILWGSDESSNQSAIESAINSYYSIY